jgi:uncharacterized protein YceK
MKRGGVALSLLALAGCGTVQNFSRPEDGGQRPLQVYGGVTYSVDTVKKLVSSDLVEAAWAPIFAPDVVLSAIGDTLTLPVTASAAAARAIADGIRDYYFPKEKPKPPADDQPGHLTPERIHGGIL